MGTWNNFFYRPSQGASGLDEYTKFDTGLVLADAEILLDKTHRQATSNVHGLVFTGPGSGGGLDADKLDGYHSTNFVLSGGSIATAISASEADKLDGYHATDFILSGGSIESALSASDSDKLDGYHSTDFILSGGSIESALSASDSDKLDGYHATDFVLSGGSIATALSASEADTLDGYHAAAFALSGSTSVAGADTQVQFNDGGSFGADADLTWDKTKDRLYAKELVVGIPWFDARKNGDLGAVDASATIQTTIDQAYTAGGGNVILPVNGYVNIASPLTISGNNISFGGEPGFVTSLLMNSATKNMIVVRPVNPTNSFLAHFTLHDLIIQKHTTKPTAGINVFLNSVIAFNVKNIRVMDGFINMKVAGGLDGIMEDLYLVDASLLGGQTANSIGLEFAKSTHTTIPHPVNMRVSRFFVGDGNGYKYRMFGIKISSADGIWLTDGHVLTAYSASAYINPEASTPLNAVYWNSIYLDSAYDTTHAYGAGLYYAGATTGGYGYIGHSFIGGSIINGDGVYGNSGVVIENGCNVEDVNICGPTIANWRTGYGVYIGSTVCKDVMIHGCSIWGNGVAGVVVLANASRFSIQNNRVGKSSSSQAYSIIVNNNCHRFMVTGNQCKNNTLNTIGIGSGTSKSVVANNEDSAD